MSRLKAWSRRLGLLAIASLIGLWVLNILFPFPKQLIEAALKDPATWVLDDRESLLARRVNKSEEYFFPVAYAQMSPWISQAIIACEDKRFYQHPGVDIIAVIRAMVLNVVLGRRVSGASTITMQCIRLMRPAPRTWSNKLIEGFRALQLEALMSKEEIMELYLNLAPFGGNRRGIEAAARMTFAKGAKDLNLSEAALLAGIPQRPAYFDPLVHPQRIESRRNWVLERMYALGFIPLHRYVLTRDLKLRVSGQTKELRPGIVDWLHALGESRRGVVKTTLDAGLVSELESKVAAHVSAHAAGDLDGVGVAVLRVSDAKLLGVVGRLAEQEAWVNGALLMRPPGSLLKPFLYARCYDEGWLVPEEFIDDLPTNFAGYAPRNMDLDYRGRVRVGVSLRQSLNIPAVSLHERLGTSRFKKVLEKLGIVDKSGMPAELSDILGHKASRLPELLRAYACLAALGEGRDISMTPGSTRQSGRVFSRGAALLTLQSMSGRHEARVIQAHKTGTSWNHRDAWAFVVTPRHVIGVWRGLLSGRSHTHLTGAKAALPLALKIAESLRRDRDVLSWPVDEVLKREWSCAHTGLLPSSTCPKTEAYRVRGHAAVRVCMKTHEKTTSAKSEGVLRLVSPKPGSRFLLTTAEKDLEISLKWYRRGIKRVLVFVDEEKHAEIETGEQLSLKLGPGEHEVLICGEGGENDRMSFAVERL